MQSPEINPYILEIHNYKDLIWTSLEEEKSDCKEFIASGRDLILDIGCGAGNFLRDFAKANPNTHFIGFDLRYKRLVKGARKFQKHNLSNIRLIRENAEKITGWVPLNSADLIHINFPDPWPKKRHHKHRLFRLDYLGDLKTVLKKNGEIVFKSDHRDYFFWARDILRQQNIFEITEYSENLHLSPYQASNIMTEFELLFKNQGLTVYYLKIKSK
ncbi:MAG: tRNA (guanosine(46)-N7)-methyltransferase TrmB [Deltaproteobacteria bacterium]|nr:tRNA (guanosine(46)-N7)-methyltransferase TrmB [Deltaproteobacteria bacterium]